MVEEAVQILESTAGPDYPHTINAHMNLGAMQRRLGNDEAANEQAEIALAAAQRTFGPEHPQTAMLHFNVGNGAMITGHLEKAEQNFTTALQIAEKTFPEGVAERGFFHVGMGSLEQRLGRTEEAITSLERALELFGESKNPMVPPARAEAQFALAKALWERDHKGDRTRARELALAAKPVEEAQGEPRADVVAEINAWLEAHG
jgi:tetratricopeptide (TPR) repeat protein